MPGNDIAPSLSFLPKPNDWVDAHGYPEEDEIFWEKIKKFRDAAHHKGEQIYPWHLSSVEGIFKQSLDHIDDMKFDYIEEDFGVIGSWEDAIKRVNELNSHAADNESYKMFLLARHGQGWHNVGFHKHGQESWVSKWRFLSGDGVITWGPDADLTEIGLAQARYNNDALKKQIENGAPIPSKMYVSPLKRSCKTLKLTWKGIETPRPIVKEKLRETIGLNLCHRRSTKSEIAKNFPDFQFEHGFSEHDLLHESYKEKERLHEQFLRITEFLQEVFEEEWAGSSIDKKKRFDEQIISVTCHAGTIRAFLTATSHRMFTIPTCGIIGVVIKGTRIMNHQ
ncbi:Piso0_004686 [Millerozyma farinosa CBS 7064]|uniref:Piso0_004686 protein n=1 Tax=Pichia sorbitophila (strain ATCC MYA-4447 / BCRC 22081 / CBS 7064 / NBRC 10061 / NRRL Y-12695) TaxID=559304 RepID=G8Y653_PICSO|nr:Piso0_004686 [Millerozyma farinosa CBS 7064]CCE85114.1 Piso0_004686 [Millerozyma farinosa CBS 7064]